MRTTSTKSTVRRRAQAHRSMAVLLSLAVIAGACTGDDDESASTTEGPGTTTGSSTVGSDPGTSAGGASGLLRVRLSPGQVAAQGSDTGPELVTGTPLDAAAIAAVTGRLPEWDASAEGAEDFAWPAATPPAPRTGAEVATALQPTAATAPEVASGPLDVVRISPSGDVDVAGFLAVTFNQPMVPVGTVEQLGDLDVPVELSPQVEGSWRWVGTRTLRFDATVDGIDRLPMATVYTVTVPAGTTSATGGELADEVTAEFTTPPVSVRSFIPQDGPIALTPVFVATFDQRIDPAAVLGTVTLEADGDERSVRLATDAEIEADESARAAVASAPEGRWLAFRATDTLPTDADLDIVIGPGTPSAEGPALSDDAADYDAFTYAPLDVTRSYCSWGDDCPPGTELSIEFNNPLDAERFDPSALVIEPALPGVIASVYGQVIQLRGVTAPDTTYRVTVPAALTDTFGQQLGATDTVEFEIGSAQPYLEQVSGPMVTLDPFTDPGFSVRSTGHDQLKVEVYEVQPSDWAAYMAYVTAQYNGDGQSKPLPDFELLSDTTIDTGNDPNQAGDTLIDLSDHIDDGLGQVVVRVSPTTRYTPSDELYWQNQPILVWAQATDLALDVSLEADELLAWVTDLRTGAPVPGAELITVPGGQRFTTDADGLVRATLPGTAIQGFIAGRDTSRTVAAAGWYGERWTPTARTDEVRWYVTDDRGVYQPGETLHVKGWLRRFTSSGDGQLSLFGRTEPLTYVVRDAQGVELATGSADVSPLGGFDAEIAVPAETNLGYATVEFDGAAATAMPNTTFWHSFQIESYRRPEFEVTVATQGEGPFTSAAPTTVEATAAYFAGGFLGAAPVNWTVTSGSASYAPPGWDDFTFGEWIPWWWDGGLARSSEECCFPDSDTETATFTGTTDAAGVHRLQVDYTGDDGVLPDLPRSVSAEAFVTDLNQQGFAGRSSWLVHPADRYVGLRSEQAFVKAGNPMTVEAILTDIDGEAVAGQSLTLTAARREWVYTKGQWGEQSVDPQTCTVTSASDAVSCEFTTTVAGRYRVSSTVSGSSGGSSRTELDVWVAGADAAASRRVGDEGLAIVPDAKVHEPGDVAELLVVSPVSGHGLAVVTRNGIESATTFEVVDGSGTVSVPIDETMIPGIDVTIEVVGASTRTNDDGSLMADGPKRPAFATGQITVPVSTAGRRLTVTAEPEASEVPPGSVTSIDVTVQDASGDPVSGAEVAVIVVDEAVLAVSGKQFTDPTDAFYASASTYLSTTYGRSTVVLSDPKVIRTPGVDDSAPAETEAPASAEEAPASTTVASGAVADGERDNAAGGQATSPILERTDFDPLALFDPDVITGADGSARLTVDLPDNLTRYRVVALAVHGPERFGSGESTLTARQPLMVRPSAPRFANFGDRFELPVLLQNQTDAALEVDVVAQVDNLSLTAGAGQRVTVPANDRIEVRFPIETDAAGAARVRIAAASGDLADAQTVELPVYTPATAEAMATYGTLDAGAMVQPVLTPAGVEPSVGGLEVTMSSTSLQALTDAVLYVTDYPYRSADALATRIVTITALADVLDAFGAPDLPPATELKGTVADDVTALVALQGFDGGFHLWGSASRTDPFVTVSATQALVAARDDGTAVPDGALESALGYLASIEQYLPSEWSQADKDRVIANALAVRAQAGDRDADAAEQLWKRSGATLGIEGIALLWPVIDDATLQAEFARLVNNAAVETADAVTFATGASDADSFVFTSGQRTDALMLQALLSEQRDSDLIAKVVTGLLSGRRAGRWDTLYDNLAVIVALRAYYDAFEASAPSFTARTWVGERHAAEQRFQGRSTDRVVVDVPMRQLLTLPNADVVVSHEGSGRLYYRVGLRYAPDDLTLDASDQGFVVERRYEAVDDPADVVRNADGSWTIAAGARVRVRVTMVAESQRSFVALVDPLPAGFEILNPDLATTPALPEDAEGTMPVDMWCDWWCWGTWFEHQNLRDDRAEAFTSLLGGGTYDYTYVARATTSGTFVVPPARAEQLYAPETFGRSGSTTVTVR